MLTQLKTAITPLSANGHCAVCHAPAFIDWLTRQLSCGHFAFCTRDGVVIGWVNTVDMTLNLDRVLRQFSDATRNEPAQLVGA